MDKKFISDQFNRQLGWLWQNRMIAIDFADRGRLGKSRWRSIGHAAHGKSP